MLFDYKKEYKEFYLPPKKPGIVRLPAMHFLAVRGQGDPNEEAGAYKQAVGMLYAVAFTIKMSKTGRDQPEGYFDYVVPPLEGLWWQNGVQGVDYTRKGDFQWISLIRLPEFVTEEVFAWALRKAEEKKQQDFSPVEFFSVGGRAVRPVYAHRPLRRRARHRGRHEGIRPKPGVCGGFWGEPVSPRDLSQRCAPVQPPATENRHPASYKETAVKKARTDQRPPQERSRGGLFCVFAESCGFRRFSSVLSAGACG